MDERWNMDDMVASRTLKPSETTKYLYAALIVSVEGLGVIFVRDMPNNNGSKERPLRLVSYRVKDEPVLGNRTVREARFRGLLQQVLQRQVGVQLDPDEIIYSFTYGELGEPIDIFEVKIRQIRISGFESSNGARRRFDDKGRELARIIPPEDIETKDKAFAGTKNIVHYWLTRPKTPGGSS